MPSPTKWVCLPVVFLVAFWTRLPAMGQGQGSPVDSPSMVPAQSASRDPDAVQAPAQSAPKNGGDSLTLDWNDVEQSIWANAKTYVDLPVPDLVGAVPELKALAPETSQEGLASLLGHIGQSCVDLFRHTPNLASHEVQITQQRGVNRISQGAFAPELTHSERQEFGYLLLFRATQDVTELPEYRTDKHGRPIVSASSQAGQMTVGFVSEWLRLLPGNQPELRFRYLGREVMDGHKTIVIAFAQIPGHVKYPARFLFDRTLITALFQGIVWVDASDFRLVAHARGSAGAASRPAFEKNDNHHPLRGGTDSEGGDCALAAYFCWAVSSLRNLAAL